MTDPSILERADLGIFGRKWDMLPSKKSTFNIRLLACIFRKDVALFLMASIDSILSNENARLERRDCLWLDRNRELH
jgi:hypothetical protein